MRIAEARAPRLSRERLDATRRRGRVETEEALAQPLRGPGHFGIRAHTEGGEVGFKDPKKNPLAPQAIVCEGPIQLRCDLAQRL